MTREEYIAEWLGLLRRDQTLLDQLEQRQKGHNHLDPTCRILRDFPKGEFCAARDARLDIANALLNGDHSPDNVLADGVETRQVIEHRRQCRAQLRGAETGGRSIDRHETKKSFPGIQKVPCIPETDTLLCECSESSILQKLPLEADNALLFILGERKVGEEPFALQEEKRGGHDKIVREMFGRNAVHALDSLKILFGHGGQRDAGDVELSFFDQ